MANDNIKSAVFNTQSLQQSLDLFSKAFHASPAMIAIAEMEGNHIGQYIDVNESFLEKTEYSREDVIARNAADLEIFDSLFSNNSIMSILANEGYIRDFEMPFKTRSKNTRYAIISVESIHVDEMPCIMLVAVDITDRKNAIDELKQHRDHLEEIVELRTRELLSAVSDLEDEISERRKIESELVEATERAEAANRAKSDFLANMSHELRTPLNSIIGFSELMATEPDSVLTDAHHEKLKYILDSAWHLMSLINDILDLSKIEAGKMSVDLKDVDLAELISESLVMIREKAGQKGITLTEYISPDLGLVKIDERKIKQILVNLLSNAVKFTPRGGRVDVLASLTDIEELKRHSTEFAVIETAQRYVKISVIDTGIGIDFEEREKVFQPFHQIDSSFTRQYAGTGLGLNLCKQLVELHGGVIWLNSIPGEGSEFSFILPIA